MSDRVADYDLSVFLFRMLYIIEDEGEWTSEYGCGFSERDTVFPLVPDRFLCVPLESYTHGGLRSIIRHGVLVDNRNASSLKVSLEAFFTSHNKLVDKHQVALSPSLFRPAAHRGANAFQTRQYFVDLERRRV